MRRLCAIVGREWSAFFRGAAAPVVATGFLLLSGLFFTFLAYGYSQLSLEAQKSGHLQEAALNLADSLWQPLAMNCAGILLLLLPAVTMRLLAEEYRSGRYDLIMTWPVPEWMWVAGKFLFAFTVGAAFLAAAGGFLIAGLIWLGTPEAGPLLAALLGLLLVAALIAAWGVFFSTLFEHQIVAYILTFAFLLLLYVAGGLEPHVPAPLGRMLVDLSLIEHFRRFARGLVDSRDVLYFLGWIALGLAAATASLSGRRLAGARRAGRWAPVAALAALLVVASPLVARFPLTGDWTRNSRYSLSPQTAAVLRDLAVDVKATAFYQRLDPRRGDITNLLAAFADRSPRFRWDMVDPDRELGRLQAFGVTTTRTVVVEAEGRRRNLPDPDEGTLINTVHRLVTATRPVVYYIVGHGEHRLDSEERAGYSALAALLQGQGYEVRTLLLVDEALVPHDADLVVLSAPKTDLAPVETAALGRYVRDGGSVLVLADPGTPRSVATWLAEYNVGLGGDYLVTAGGAGASLGFDPRVAIVDEGYDGEHPATRSMPGLATFFPFAQSLGLLRDPPPGFDARFILRTGPRSWADRDSTTIAAGRPRYTEGVDRPGPLPLGVAIDIDRARFFGVEGISAAPLAPTGEPTKNPFRRQLEWQPPPQTAPSSVFAAKPLARLVVIGDSDFAANANLDLYGNRDLVLGTIAWLAREAVLVQLRPRGRIDQPRVLSPTERDLLGWSCILGWPLLVGGTCAVVVARRRRA